MLVTGGEERAVLAVCRALGSHGYDVCVAAARRTAVAHWSRSCRERVLVADPLVDEQAFVAGLERELAHGAYALLLPGNDAALAAVSEHRERLEQYVRLGLPPRDAVERSLDKVALGAAAAGAGLDSPPSRVCDDPERALDAAAELGYPVVLKPARIVVRAGGGMRRRGALPAHDPEELGAAWSELGAPLIVQRLEGDAEVVWISGVVAGGSLRALAAGRFRSAWPPVGGSASTAESFEPGDDLVARVEALLGLLGWEGIFQLQLLELADGRFAAIDLNPRPSGSLALDVAAGANLPAVWCDWQLGRAPALQRGRVGVVYRWEEGELRRLLRRVPPPDPPGDRRRGRRVAYAHLSRDDPGPSAALVLDVGYRALRSLGRRAGGSRR